METVLSIDKFELIPGRVEAAMQYVRHCQSLTDPDSCCPQRTGRALTGNEQAAYTAALDALRLYFTAEMDFGGPPTRVPEATQDNREQQRQKKDKRKKRADD